MGIIINLDVMMTKGKLSLKELVKKVAITNTNLSIIKIIKLKPLDF